MREYVSLNRNNTNEINEIKISTPHKLKINK